MLSYRQIPQIILIHLVQILFSGLLLSQGRAVYQQLTLPDNCLLVRSWTTRNMCSLNSGSISKPMRSTPMICLSGPWEPSILVRMVTTKQVIGS